MCLYPKLVINPHYKANKTNKGIIPKCRDLRVKYIAVGCGKCLECRKQKAAQWRVRLYDELRYNYKDIQFVTLTFSEDYLTELTIEAGSEDAACKLAIKRFRERYRKQYGKSIKHWLVTERGGDNGRIHMHGFLWCKREDVKKYWKYGYSFCGNFVNERSINYMLKYVTKYDYINNYNGIILCSPGIGKKGITRIYNYNRTEKIETTRLPNGQEVALPIYYRNHIFNRKQREKLWLSRLNKNERWVQGIKIKANDFERYRKILHTAQQRSNELGFGKREDWNEKEYLIQCWRLDKERKISQFREISQKKPYFYENRDIFDLFRDILNLNSDEKIYLCNITKKTKELLL